MNTIKVLIADGYLLYRTGLINFLKGDPGISVIGEAVNGIDLIQQYEELLPDLVITDISLPLLNGGYAVKHLREKYPDIKVLFLTVDHLDQQIIDSTISLTRSKI